METLVIVRRIREAESLAASGQHDDASRLLEPLLTADELTDTHRELISKKIDLFKRQKDRLTRVISRRATAIRTRDDSDDSAERTAIREAIGDSKQTIIRGPDDDKSDRPTGPATKVPGNDNPTESVPVPKSFKPGTRMLTPEMLRPSSQDDHQTETEIPRRSTETEVPGLPANETEIPGQPAVRDSIIEPLPVHKDEDSRELAPIRDDTDLSSQPDSGNSQDPRETDIFEARFESKKTRTIYRKHDDVGTGEVKPEVADDDTPTIVRASLGKPIAPSNDTPAGWHDSPAVKVTDSIIMPQVPKPEPSYSPDSAFIEAEDYASQPDSGKSSPELKALANRLPDDDLRRELALEVVQLREQMAKLKRREERRDSTRSRISREDKPESGQFHIPASQANTIVRRASGGKGIDVHMPSRDEDIEDLAVLHKDSVRGKKVESEEDKRKRAPTDRIALASDYAGNEGGSRPNLWKPLGVYLGFVVIVAVVCWGVYLGYRAMGDGSDGPMIISGQEVSGHKLGQDVGNLKGSPEWSANTHTSTLMSSDGRFSLRYDSNNRLIAVAVMITDIESMNDMQVHFRAKSFELSEAGSIEELLKAFGSVAPSPPFSDSVFSTRDEGTLIFIDDTTSDSKPVVLEFHYVGRDAKHPKWVQLRYEAAANVPPQFHRVEK